MKLNNYYARHSLKYFKYFKFLKLLKISQQQQSFGVFFRHLNVYKLFFHSTYTTPSPQKNPNKYNQPPMVFVHKKNLKIIIY